ncbi:MAG TPA: sigma-70 family RNA polymerase sigma factor [Polyangia bacterium]|nr:sigma-70 family RNA polymerase sigma factor [Polyangia bacterium]
MTEVENAQALIRKALSGDGKSTRALVERLSPIVAKRVAGALWQRRQRRDVAQEVGDMVQDVFLSLFVDGGKALRAWDPARGMSLDGFVGMLAQHQAISILRNGRTSPWRDEPTETAALDALGETTLTPESVAISREKLQLLLDRVRETLSPRGLELFQRIVVDGEPPESLVAATGMTRDAIYQWKSRFARKLKELAEELETPRVSDPAIGSRTDQGDNQDPQGPEV